jgi:hypothetical protein
MGGHLWASHKLFGQYQIHITNKTYEDYNICWKCYVYKGYIAALKLFGSR